MIGSAACADGARARARNTARATVLTRKGRKTTLRAMPARALHWDGARLRVLDQTALPFAERELELRGADDVAGAIRRLAVRGAPLIGIAAAYGMAMALATGDDLDRSAEVLRSARPTAVNLAWAVDRVVAAAR